MKIHRAPNAWKLAAIFVVALGWFSLPTSFAQSPPATVSSADALIRAAGRPPEKLEEELRTNSAINISSSDRVTPWCYVLTMEGPSKIAIFLKYGADPNHVFRPDCKIEGGQRPIHLATIFAKPQALKLLLENGADVNGVNGVGLTALHYVALNGQPDVARLLLAAGADVHFKGPGGETPAIFAKSAGERGILNSETEKLIGEAARRTK